jgi:predicted  nucleic acid-binding Zn-ribbon protein
MNQITISIGPGELLDRLSILSIKLSCATSSGTRRAILQQIADLGEQRDMIREHPEIGDLEQELATINRTLWDVEDQLRASEVEKNFDAGFVELARSVYRLNDRRATIRSRIDRACGSATTEYKFYACDVQALQGQ